MNGKNRRQKMICRNCGSIVQGRCCGNCGQKSSVGRITFSSLWHEAAAVAAGFLLCLAGFRRVFRLATVGLAVGFESPVPGSFVNLI
jgi:hypothetical protein